MACWLMKSEPDELSIADLAAAPATAFVWTGVRNYQARNFMRDAMAVGDTVLFWHSSCEKPGLYGLAEVAATGLVDPTQFDPASPYFDPKATHAAPRWQTVSVRFAKQTAYLSPAALRAIPGLEGMTVLKRGNRLSITPVTDEECRILMEILA
ncbi:putative RNA-binding protein with PUA-like domain [Crenobacter luteus]|uniref:EVE domain-containing protein n=1 Tax=Crenobacter luteus TaxID=1452487 RepID=A0A163CV47_9NEIS|nr:EVE domain-containing protein [Crenobacter luteus]KZE33241.1 EVE domain-containing protein [Crenobacter luteus]TCP13675.1 putative RNA-binding protein with PUA-like domain [Crenobacter luteus]